MIGRTLSHFKITAKLGEGGMGVVYRADDTKLGREVAVKVLPEAFASDPERLARFEREAKALAALNHSNIASIYEIGQHEGTHFLAQELIPGETLAERLAGGPLGIREALRFAHSIARALEAAHANQVIHRDLKPLNIKITPAGEVKLLDFGLAKIATASPATDAGDEDETLPAVAELTRAGTVLGTPAYMSPEQIRGRSVDHRTDIWAFGCVLFEMLTGGKPFPGPSDPDVLAAILKEDIDRSALPGETPTGIRSLIDRCLRKEADRRLSIIADARVDIEEALQDSTRGAPSTEVTLESATSGGPPGQPGPARRGRLLAALALMAGLAAAIWALSSSRQNPQPAITDRSIAVLPFETLGDAEGSVFADGIHGDMLTKLSTVADLEVTSRTSVMQFRDSRATLPAIADELGVAWILVGEVQQVGDQVQVNARLIDASADRQVWAESYQRQLTAENLFRIQGELTRQIVEQLAGQLSPDEEQRMGLVPTENLDAYRLYVHGRALLDPRTEEDLRRAIEYFRQAIDRDPVYALAWAGLSNALALTGFYEYAPLQEVLPDAFAAAERAIDLDPSLGEAHAALGIVHSLRREGPAAVRALERSLVLDPSFAPAHAWLGWVEDLLGNPERALIAAKRAAEVNPLSPAFHAYLAEAYMANKNYEAAASESARSRELQADYALAHYMEGLALLHLDRLDEAEEALGKALSLALSNGVPTRSEVLAVLGVVHTLEGDNDSARALLAEIEGSDSYSTGLVLAALGETREALDAFRAVEQWGFTATPHIRYLFPDVLKALRAEAEFEEVLQTVDRSFGKDP